MDESTTAIFTRVLYVGQNTTKRRSDFSDCGRRLNESKKKNPSSFTSSSSSQVLICPLPVTSLLLFVFLRLLALERRVRGDRSLFVVFIIVLVHLVGDVGAFLSGQTPQQQRQDADQHQQDAADDPWKAGDTRARHQTTRFSNSSQRRGW